MSSILVAEVDTTPAENTDVLNDPLENIDLEQYEQIESTDQKDIYKIPDKNGGYSYLVCPKTDDALTEDEASCPAGMDADACLTMLNADDAVDEDVDFKDCFVIGSGQKTIIVLGGKDIDGSVIDGSEIIDQIDLSEIKEEIREIIKKALEKQDLAGIFGDENLNSVNGLQPNGDGYINGQQGNKGKEESSDISDMLQQFMQMQQLKQLLGGNRQNQGGGYPAGIGGGSPGGSPGFQGGGGGGASGGCSTCNSNFSGSNQGGNGQGDGKVQDPLSETDKMINQRKRLIYEIERLKEDEQNTPASSGLGTLIKDRKAKEAELKKVTEKLNEKQKAEGKTDDEIEEERKKEEKEAKRKANGDDTDQSIVDPSDSKAYNDFVKKTGKIPSPSQTGLNKTIPPVNSPPPSGIQCIGKDGKPVPCNK